MPQRKLRFVLLSQDPLLTQLVREALDSGRGRQVIDVREANLLPPVLDRGADLVVIDLSLPDKMLTAVAAIVGERRHLPVVVLASQAADWDQLSRGNPLEAVVEFPFTVPAVSSAANDLLEKAAFLHERLVGTSELMQELRDRILLIAPTPVTVLISGESGTGKDVAALALHHYSQRDQKPFRAVNCAAIPENLIENELFGHEKGAFTDARSQHLGIFEQAHRGTVFLDEIGEMPLAAQVRLLRVLEQREVTRVGGSSPTPVDVRVIAATNRDLQVAVAEGHFRRDLYHRLKVVELSIPPLRRHPEDITPLIDHFNSTIPRQNGRHRFKGFSAAAMRVLEDYNWPGNIRELRNLVESLVFLGPDVEVEPADLIPHLELAPDSERHLPVPTSKTPDQSERELIYFALLDLKREVSDLKQMIEQRVPAAAPRPVWQRPGEQVMETPFVATEAGAAETENGVKPLKDMEREAIELALDQVDGNRKMAAKKLGIGVRTLYRKLDEYGLK
jgi:DNA-binding NtrC family response regulator